MSRAREGQANAPDPNAGRLTRTGQQKADEALEASMQPSHSTRFRKGQSGNPAGRPRVSKKVQPASSLAIVLERTLTITQGGVAAAMTLDEALQHKTYQNAIAGDRGAQRAVFRMIAKREQALAQRSRPAAPASAPLQIEEDPDNADEALLILGVADLDATQGGQDAAGDRRLQLEPWAVQAALDRRGRPGLTPRDVDEVKRCTRRADTLVWPRGQKR